MTGFRRAARAALRLGQLGAIAVLAGCGGAPPPARPPPSIVLVTIDTLRADRLGRGFTPALDALAREGLSFSNARATVPLTLPSHLSIMTGTLPPEHGVRQNGVNRSASLPTLAQVLRERGYQTAAFVGAYVLDRRFGLADGFDLYDDHIPRVPNASTPLETERPADRVVAAARDWLTGVDPAKPVFLWVHLYDPHAPYAPPADHLRRAGGHPYDGEVSFADEQTGVLLADVRQRIGSAPIVAVTGDHGEGLGDHGESTHGMLAYDSTLKVPLILSGPGIARAARVDRPVSLRDIAPTLLALAGAAVPSQMTASDLLSPGGSAEVYAETTYPHGAGWSPLRAIADERWKLIVSSEHELYDMTRDAGEQHNVAASHPSVVAAMASRAERIFASGDSAPGAISPDAAERLRALGYVAASATAAVSSTAPNPREGIGAWNRFETTLSLLSARRASEALPELRRLSSTYPDSRLFQATLAQALKDAGQLREALRLYRRLVARWPEEATLFHDLAVAAREAGDEQEALRAERAALALEPNDPNAHNGLGLLHADAGRSREAAAAFERAIALDPNNVSFWTNRGNALRALGDLAAARQAYLRALEISPRYADAANGLGVVLVQEGQPGDAVARFEQAIAADPQLYEAQVNLGIALQASGDRHRAAEQYRHVVATAPRGSKERRAASELLAALR
jgi:choline-sulfatase